MKTLERKQAQMKARNAKQKPNGRPRKYKDETECADHARRRMQAFIYITTEGWSLDRVAKYFGKPIDSVERWAAQNFPLGPTM